MKVVKAKIAELKLDASNARSHSERNIDAISKSLEKFGQQKPIVIDEDNIVIAGNGTLEAAKRLGWKTLSVVVTELESIDKTAFGLADNRTAELAVWDMGQLADHVGYLQDVDGMLEAVGFNDGELEKLFNEIESPDEFEAVDPEAIDLDNICPQCGFEF